MRGLGVVAALVIIAIVAIAATVIMWYIASQHQNVTFSWSTPLNQMALATWSGGTGGSTQINIVGLSNPSLDKITVPWDEKAVAVEGVATLFYNTAQMPWRISMYQGSKGKDLPWWAWSGDYYKVSISTQSGMNDYCVYVDKGQPIFKIQYSSASAVKTSLGVIVSKLRGSTGIKIKTGSNGQITIIVYGYYKHHITLDLLGTFYKYHKDNPFSTHLVKKKPFGITKTFEVVTIW